MTKLLLIFLLLSFQVHAKKKNIDELDTGLHEPLFIDLIRPINSVKGDLEVNTLCYNQKGKVLCAPEVEYVIKDGLAIEFELPMEGVHIEAYKFAVQQRILRGGLSKDYDHAVQVVFEKARHAIGGTYSVLYYVAGWHRNNWSVVSMNGIAREGSRYIKANNMFVANITGYYNQNQKFAYGLEYNYHQAGYLNGDIKNRILPQIKYDHNGYELQFGIGIQNKSLLIASRLIYVF